MFNWLNKLKDWNKKNQEEIQSQLEKKKKAEDRLYEILDDINDPTAYSVLDQSIKNKPSIYSGDPGDKY